MRIIQVLDNIKYSMYEDPAPILSKASYLQLADNMYFVAILYDKHKGILLDNVIKTSDKRIYITKDCLKPLVGSHTQWNAIVAVENGDNIYEI